MKCRRCQQDNPAAQKFCGECGTPLKAVGHTDPPAPSYAEVTSALDEALEQQAATREILRVISGSPTDVQPVLNVVAENAARLCGADDAVIQRVDGGALRFAAHFGRIPTPPEHALMPITREMAVGSAVLDRRTVHVHDMAEELRRGKYPASRPYRDCDPYRTLLCVPLVREDVAVGVIVMRRAQVQPFTDEQIALVKTFADQAVIAIENARLFRDLSESLDQQTATSEILRVISSSLTDIQPVLDRMAESAARFCQAYDATIFRANGDELRLVAHHGAISSLPLGSIIPLTPAGVATRAVLERRPIHVADIELEADEFPVAAAHARALGNRTMLAVPLLREQVALGAILLRRIEPDPFTDKQIGLLRIFADQAVIAIENVRLFTELRENNRALSESLEQQTATSEILRVISSSPTDLQPVFKTSLVNANRLWTPASPFSGYGMGRH